MLNPLRPVRIPLSVFIASDMLELAQAHATHRFVIADEESGEKRILVCSAGLYARFKLTFSDMAVQPICPNIVP
jgi:hypothetical protein